MYSTTCPWCRQAEVVENENFVVHQLLHMFAIKELHCWLKPRLSMSYLVCCRNPRLVQKSLRKRMDCLSLIRYSSTAKYPKLSEDQLPQDSPRICVMDVILTIIPVSACRDKQRWTSHVSMILACVNKSGSNPLIHRGLVEVCTFVFWALGKIRWGPINPTGWFQGPGNYERACHGG